MVDVVCGVAAGDDCAGVGDLADAVAEVVGGPDVAALIDGEAVGAVAAGDAEGLGAVGGDAGDGVVELIADPGVVAGVDGDAGGKGEGRGGVAGGGRKGLAGAGERGEAGVAVVDDPGGAVGIDGDGDGEVQAAVGEAGAGDGLAGGVVFGYGTETLVDGIGTLFVWDPDVVTGVDGEAVGVGEAGGAYAVGEQRLADGGEFGGDAYGAVGSV